MTKPNPALTNKRCDVCDERIAGKRVRRGRKDDLYRCTPCQALRNRELQTAYMREALQGEKAIRYRDTRNRAKRAWEGRNPEGKRARSLIKSVKTRLKQYGYDPTRFQRPSTQELAEAIMKLPATCQSCETDQDLTIEHIQPIVDFPELALDPSNLTTLCRPCNTRSYYGD